jgi:thiol-disulfide isomerase/thioredoxin
MARSRLGKMIADGGAVSTRPPDRNRLELFRAQRRLKGQPLVLAGVDLEGKPLSTEQWKGKVVLVDFWASWCAPCAAELPKLKALYEKHNVRGLEVVGVSLDSDRDDLNQFVMRHPGTGWAQMLDSDGRTARGLVRKCGVMAIPQLFLIDKRGVLRSIHCRRSLEEAVVRLLQE